MAERLTFTEEHKFKFLELYRSSSNMSKSSKELGFTPQTIRYHMNRDEVFRLKFDDIQQEINDELEELMLQQAQMKGAQGFVARIAYLKAHGRRDKWSDKITHEHTSKDNKGKVDKLFKRIDKK